MSEKTNSSDFDWLALIDSLGSNLAWPLVIVAALWFFHKDISGLLSRLRSVSRTGADFETPKQSVQPKTEIEVMADKPLAGQFKLPDHIGEKEPVHPAVQETAKHLRRLFDEMRLSSPDERENFLLYRLTQSFFRENFEAAYGVIFGTQLQALAALESGSVLDLSPHHAEHVAKTQEIFGAENPDVASSFDAWFNFLSNFSLVEGTKESARISPIGRLFLIYLRENGRTFVRWN